MAFVAAHPTLQDYVAHVINRHLWPRQWMGELPPSLLNGNWNKLREAAALIGTAAFDDALKKFLPGGLDAMRPCFSAIAHGAAAGRHQEAYSEVFLPRVERGNEKFVAHKLGALNAELTALSSFFDALWGAPAIGLRENTKYLALGQAAFALERWDASVRPLSHTRQAFGLVPPNVTGLTRPSPPAISPSCASPSVTSPRPSPRQRPVSGMPMRAANPTGAW